MATERELSEDLHDAIGRYLDAHRSRSLSTLARATSVSYTTLRRFYQREGKPTAEPVLKIIDAALPHGDKLAFINKHFPEIATTISRLREDAYSPKASRGDLLKAYFVRDPFNFILNLAHNSKGTTAADVRRLLGEKGVRAFQELVETEVLERGEEAGVEVFKLPTFVSYDVDMGLAQMRLSADHFDVDLIGTKAARFCHATASLNLPALEKIHDCMSAFLRELAAIKDDPQSAGTIPFFADVMMNVYDKTALEQEGFEA